MKNFTLFTVPRAFAGEYGVIQTNAIQSWKACVEPKPEILLMGGDPGVKEAARKWGCVHAPAIRTNEFGTPLVSSIFKRAQAIAEHELVGYTNSDILFWMPAVREALERVSGTFDRFLMIGRRWDFYHPRPIDFSAWGSQKFLHTAKKRGKLHGPSGIDYFFFPKGLYGKIPDYGLGRRAWDNALVRDILRRGIPVVDATEVMLAIHIGKTTNKPITEEVRHNRKLAGNAGTWGRTTFATWRLGPIRDIYE